MTHFEIFKDKADQFRWRLRASNGKIIADSSEGYVDRRDCEHGIELVQTESPNAPVKDVDA